MRLIKRMVLLANRHGQHIPITMEGWTARPMSVSAHLTISLTTDRVPQVQKVQMNGYDCGIWILSCIAAVLRGYHVCLITENDLQYVRRFIYDLALALPAQKVVL